MLSEADRERVRAYREQERDRAVFSQFSKDDWKAIKERRRARRSEVEKTWGALQKRFSALNEAAKRGELRKAEKAGAEIKGLVDKLISRARKAAGTKLTIHQAA